MKRRNTLLRTQIKQFLLDGKTYKEISKELGASPTTISRVKKAMEQGETKSTVLASSIYVEPKKSKDLLVTLEEFCYLIYTRKINHKDAAKRLFDVV